MTWTDPDEMDVAGEIGGATFTLVRDNFKHIWSDAPRITVRLTSTQEVASGGSSDHVVQWDEAAWDSTGGDMWDVGTPGSIVVPAGAGGLYLGVAGFQFEGTTDDNSKRSFRVMKNGGDLDSDDLAGLDILSSSSPRGSFPILTSLAAGDYLELWARQLSGGAINLLANRTRFTLMLIGADPSL